MHRCTPHLIFLLTGLHIRFATREGGLERGVRERDCVGFTKKRAENKRKIGDEKRWERTGEGHARERE